MSKELCMVKDHPGPIYKASCKDCAIESISANLADVRVELGTAYQAIDSLRDAVAATKAALALSGKKEAASQSALSKVMTENRLNQEALARAESLLVDVDGLCPEGFDGQDNWTNEAHRKVHAFLAGRPAVAQDAEASTLLPETLRRAERAEDKAVVLAKDLRFLRRQVDAAREILASWPQLGYRREDIANVTAYLEGQAVAPDAECVRRSKPAAMRKSKGGKR
jgi:uncharacterized membrane protein